MATNPGKLGAQEQFQQFLEEKADKKVSAQPDQDMALYENALSAAIKQDQQVLESIQKNWTEVNKRITQRANLLQTLQTTTEPDKDCRPGKHLEQITSAETQGMQ